MINSLSVKCGRCDMNVKVESLKADCDTHIKHHREVLSKAVSQLLPRSQQTITVSTGGRPISLTKVTTPSVSSGKASQRTLHRRSREMAKLREDVSGGESHHQMIDEIRMTSKEEREEIMKELNFIINVSPEQCLGMKAELCLPWKKLRLMRRWMKAWGVNLSSEKKQREMMKSDLEAVQVTAESIPFSFQPRQGSQEIRPAPLAYVADLQGVIFHLIEEKERLNQLTWHDGVIPPNEVWVKIGGDKGGSSVKMSFQIVNTEKPNSVLNSCVFSVFEAPDNVVNLHLALDQYRDIVSALQETQWKGYNIRLFMSGDYEFLCNMYGLSGASGRHCCLWCNITSEQLKIDKQTRNSTCTIAERSLSTLYQKHDEFQLDGSNLKKAKHFNNVIGKPFFDIPLTQVCPPGLHITLGIFQRLFNLLEDECHRLDCSIAEQCDTASNSFASYIQSKTAISSLQRETAALQMEVNQAQQLLTLLILTCTATNPQQHLSVQTTAISSLIQNNLMKIRANENTITHHEKIVRKGFERDEGLFVKALDQALASFHVERQAYHGGSFIGNHIHRALKSENIQTLCTSLLNTAASMSSNVKMRASEISTKFFDAFSLFSKCHTIYDSSNLLSDEKITELETAINTFVHYYRVNFPTATFLPKLHMLEDHIVPWVKRWRIGCGCMGEQGAESLHASFNYTERAYNNMKDRVERLRVVLQNHHFRILPFNQSLQPPLLKKRKGKEADST